jgi:hypothetical protein
MVLEEPKVNFAFKKTEYENENERKLDLLLDDILGALS